MVIPAGTAPGCRNIDHHCFSGIEIGIKVLGLSVHVFENKILCNAAIGKLSKCAAAINRQDETKYEYFFHSVCFLLQTIGARERLLADLLRDVKSGSCSPHSCPLPWR